MREGATSERLWKGRRVAARGAGVPDDDDDGRHHLPVAATHQPLVHLIYMADGGPMRRTTSTHVGQRGATGMYRGCVHALSCTRLAHARLCQSPFGAGRAGCAGGQRPTHNVMSAQ